MLSAFPGWSASIRRWTADHYQQERQEPGQQPAVTGRDGHVVGRLHEHEQGGRGRRRRQEELGRDQRRVPVGDGPRLGQHLTGVEHHHHGRGEGHELQEPPEPVGRRRRPRQPVEGPAPAELQVGEDQQPADDHEDDVGDGAAADPRRPRVDQCPQEAQRPPEVGDQDAAADGDGREAEQLDERQPEPRPQVRLQLQGAGQHEQPAPDSHQREPHRMGDVPDPLDLGLQDEPVHEHVLRAEMAAHRADPST